jgi:hypothetical protein
MRGEGVHLLGGCPFSRRACGASVSYSLNPSITLSLDMCSICIFNIAIIQVKPWTIIEIGYEHLLKCVLVMSILYVGNNCRTPGCSNQGKEGDFQVYLWR